MFLQVFEKKVWDTFEGRETWGQTYDFFTDTNYQSAHYIAVAAPAMHAKLPSVWNAPLSDDYTENDIKQIAKTIGMKMES